MSSNLCQQSQAHRLYSLYLHYDASHSTKHDDPECKAVLQHCFTLFKKDYVVGSVQNHNGQLCSSYPSEIAILEKQRKPSYDSSEDSKSKQARQYPGGPQETIENKQQYDEASSKSSRRSPNSTSFLRAGNSTSSYKGIQQDITNQQDLDQSLIEDDADQSFDLSESVMMSFQDIKTELEMLHPPQQQQQQQQQQSVQHNDQDWSKRNLLPFAFRIPRPDKKVNVAIKEYVAPSPSSISRKAQEPIHLLVDNDKVNDTQELSKQFEKSHFARVRARFVVPCILVRGKNICRSATLSNEVEVFMHSVNQKINDLNQKRKMLFYGTGERSPDKEDRESSLEKQRLEDIELLHQLGVTYINDLMVENRKVKYGLKVTSSEKVDSFGRYSDFKLVATPYPGVEFFQKFKANKYSARRLCFDWSQNFADAELQLPPGHTDNLSIRWKDYKNWDLIELTQNYLRLYLTHIADDTIDTLNGNTSSVPASPSKGLLIHCISGWDRTPLFISLLRISLWADGEAHQSLTAAEMLYLTMGYDWFLFNHLLADRSQRGEDIFYFCFYFLKFIYGEEFSLKSVSNLSKSGQSTHRPSFSTQPVSSRSPLLKDIDRHRGGELGAFTGLDTEDSHGYICDECKILRRSSNEPLGRNTSCAKSGGQDAASSNDGKPSSWQLVTFATPPGRGGQGSPRAPFMPTLQAMSRQSGSPLGAARNSYSSGFGEQTRCTNPTLNQEVLNVDDQSATSPIMKDKRFHPGAQQFNARRLSSSGIPDLFAEEAKRLAQGASGFEFSRVATSPNLQFGREVEADPNSYESSKGDMGNRQSTPRKRASTFDGGLLLSTGQELNVNADDIDPKEQEDDLTSGDDDNGDEESNASNTAVERGDRHTLTLPASNKEGPQICQMCHHSFIGGSRKPSIQDNQIPAKTGALNISQQSMEAGANQALERVRAVDRLFPQEDTEQTCHHAQIANEFDRDEGMFQLEIDDRPSYRPIFSCDSKSELECLDPSCLAGAGHKDISLNGDSCVGRTLVVRGMSPAVDETGSIEGDENESFWDEASSTMDYGCSPGSILNGFGSGLAQCLQDQPTNIRLDRGHQADESIRDEDDEEEEDEDDDGAGSLNSRRNSLKMGCNENDRLFMPSLTGVFSNTDRSSQGSGRRGDNSILDSSFPTQDSPSPFEADTAHPLSSTAKDGLDAEPGQGANPETPKTLTRRQKLKQLRRLFMDIRNEIGDGNYSPSITLLDGRNRNATCSNSAGENDDDSGGSFRADSFSDDHSFASSAFINRHGSTTTTATVTSTSKRRDYDQGHSHFSRESSTRPDSDPRIVSPIPRSQYQQQQQNRPQNLSVPSSSGRKSPFEWAAAAASSAAASITTASGIVSGSFSQSNSPSMSLRQDPPLKSSPYNAQQQRYNSPSGSNHYSRPFTPPSAQSPFQLQERQHHQYNGGNGSHMRGSVSATIKSTEEFQEISSASARQPSVSGEKMGSNTNNGYGNTRRRSLATSTAASSASASKLRGNAESSGRWGDWVPGIFAS